MYIKATALFPLRPLYRAKLTGSFEASYKDFNLHIQSDELVGVRRIHYLLLFVLKSGINKEAGALNSMQCGINHGQAPRSCNTDAVRGGEMQLHCTAQETGSPANISAKRRNCPLC